MGAVSARYVIKVFLYQITPQIWRSFSISENATFRDLHEAIQDAMGWEAKHPHEFRHGKGKRLVDVIGPVGLEELVPGEFQNELEVTIKQFIGRQRPPVRILYRYDFADEWIHEVVFEQKIEGEEEGPVMIDGARNCPPEDFGGAFAFMQAMAGDIEWMNPGYDPEPFDPKKVKFGARKRGTKRKK